MEKLGHESELVHDLLKVVFQLTYVNFLILTFYKLVKRFEIDKEIMRFLIIVFFLFKI